MGEPVTQVMNKNDRKKILYNSIRVILVQYKISLFRKNQRDIWLKRESFQSEGDASINVALNAWDIPTNLLQERTKIRSIPPNSQYRVELSCVKCHVY